MRTISQRIGREDQGVLAFEWILLITLLVIGIIGGLTAARDAILSELADLASGISSYDQSYTLLNPMMVWVHTGEDGGPIPLGPPAGRGSGASDSRYNDDPEYVRACRPGTAPISPDNQEQPENAWTP